MSKRRAGPVVLFPAALLGATLVLVQPAHAEVTTAAQVVKRLDTSLQRKEAKAIQSGLASVVETFQSAEKPADRKLLLSAVAKVLRTKDVDLQSAALDAFESMHDPSAWKHYRALLRRPIDKAFTRIQSQAMDVTRALTPDGAIKPLLTIMRKSKNLSAAAKALRTLGAYKQSRSRTRILDAIISATIKEKPGIRGRDNTVWYGPRQTGEQARTRWQALVGPMVAAANELTGRDLQGAEPWFQMWRDHRRDLGALFENE